MAADVLGTRPDTAVADLLTPAEGNPLYIAELLRSTAGTATPGAGADPGRLSSAPLPASLRLAVAATCIAARTSAGSAEGGIGSRP